MKKEFEFGDYTIYYGTMRGNTTWFGKGTTNVSQKISKSKKGVYSFGTGKFKIVITDQNIIDYISPDFE